MSIKSQREKVIKTYIDETVNCSTGRTKRLEIEGKVEELTIYRLPIDKLLVFNIENGRFAADLYTIEKKEKRKLDPWEKQDRNLIQKILLEKYHDETKRLEEDLEKVGQMEAGVITAAGVVINGNRRMAILMKLHKKTSRENFNYLEVIILPRHLNDEEIYKIEARLQYAKEFKVVYGPVNELLKMREGVKKGMTRRQLAYLLGRSKKYVEDHLFQLELLEKYSEYNWKEINYKKIEGAGITEQMTVVAEILTKFKNEGLNLSEIKKYIELQFAYMKAGCTYQDIRNLKDINLYKDIKSQSLEALNQLKKKEIFEETFKELIDDAGEAIKIKKKKKQPITTITKILKELKRFYDNGYKITPEIKKNLREIKKIVHAMIIKK